MRSSGCVTPLAGVALRRELEPDAIDARQLGARCRRQSSLGGLRLRVGEKARARRCVDVQAREERLDCLRGAQRALRRGRESADELGLQLNTSATQRERGASALELSEQGGEWRVVPVALEDHAQRTCGASAE